MTDDLPVLEHVVLDVTDGPGFEAAFHEAVTQVVAATGMRHVQLQKCIERENRYLLLIEWNTLEDHTVGFRESEAFTTWRSLVGPFFTAAPDVEHYELVTSTAA